MTPPQLRLCTKTQTSPLITLIYTDQKSSIRVIGICKMRVIRVPSLVRCAFWGKALNCARIAATYGSQSGFPVAGTAQINADANLRHGWSHAPKKSILRINLALILKRTTWATIREHDAFHSFKARAKRLAHVRNA